MKGRESGRLKVARCAQIVYSDYQCPIPSFVQAQQKVNYQLWIRDVESTLYMKNFSPGGAQRWLSLIYSIVIPRQFYGLQDTHWFCRSHFSRLLTHITNASKLTPARIPSKPHCLESEVTLNHGGLSRFAEVFKQKFMPIQSLKTTLLHQTQWMLVISAAHLTSEDTTNKNNLLQPVISQITLKVMYCKYICFKILLRSEK